ncbi:Winged helix DNA-binding domain-containing protein [Mucilaginibacter pineti]|uniref:Winged helix DNA-binding domain-containing protein n=1 Tax=Mucilaginibacter pineti TaxID=1391627 RepID=A0A1G6T0L8_9SPHI|nr:Winged helix DNA-binding domain-containing protein [Mucilaginibacter pineti]
MYKKYELDYKVFSKSKEVFVNTLQGNKQLTRSEIVTALQNNDIATDELRLTLLLMHAELDAIICNGAKVGKQFTYALLDERAPSYPTLTHEEALTKLADGYFKSRGPATIHDFATWAGITVTDANIGLQNVRHQLVNEAIDGKTYWMPYNVELIADKKATAYLLPAFDEFAIAYKNRDAIVNSKYLQQARRVIFDPAIVVDNQVVGTWKRTVKTTTVNVSLNLFGKLNIAQTKAVEQAINWYKKFMI